VLSHLSAKTGGLVPAVTIWPETAYPGAVRGLTDQPWPFSKLLLTGALAVEGEGADTRIYNSVAAIDGQGNLRARYDKHQLVPFGEFVPLRAVLPLRKITPGDIDFSRGEGAHTVAIEGVPPFSPLVCYEAIFPWMATAETRPAWLLNVTNDGWYGDSAGPYQHFAMARMRAIEQGLPLARAANNGVSAVVDPYGRVVASLALNVRGILDVPLPAPLAPTFYATHSEWVMLMLLILMFIGGFTAYFTKENQ